MSSNMASGGRGGVERDRNLQEERGGLRALADDLSRLHEDGDCDDFTLVGDSGLRLMVSSQLLSCLQLRQGAARRTLEAHTLVTYYVPNQRTRYVCYICCTLAVHFA